MNDDLVFRIPVAAVILIAFTISVYFRLSAQRRGGPVSRREEGPLVLVGLRLAGLACLLLLVSYLLNPAWVHWATAPWPGWVRAAGVMLSAACLPLIYWLFRHLGKNVTDTVALRDDHRLVTTGPYRLVRHPLYTAGSMLWLGILLATTLWVLLFVFIPGLCLLVWRTRTEEANLAARFGDEYRAYAERTGRFFPRLFPRRTVTP
jgi:protein-S-isoprenylcysteine O-methyltransferase Ste14